MNPEEKRTGAGLETPRRESRWRSAAAFFSMVFLSGVLTWAVLVGTGRQSGLAPLVLLVAILAGVLSALARWQARRQMRNRGQ